jgi:NitT/TauT family transport system substrate-binding protein
MLRTSFAVLGAAATAILAIGPASAADKVRVGLPAIYTSYMVSHAAKELGYYKEKDLDVEITMYRGGTAALEAIAAGECDITPSSPASVALAQKKNIKVQLFARGGPGAPGGWYVGVPVNSPIKSPADLEGKTVGITAAGTTTDQFAQYAASKGGVKIRTAPLGGAGIVPALQAGHIDSAVLWPPVSFRLFETKEFRPIIDFGKEMGPVILDMYAASDEMISKKPDVLQRWTNALAKALIYMQNNEEWALAFLAKVTDEKDPKVNKMSYDTMIKAYEPSLAFESSWVDDSIKLAALIGLKDLPPTANLFTTKFVPAKP